MTLKLRILPVLVAVGASALIAGCTRNTLIIVAPPPLRPTVPAHMVPCRLPPNAVAMYTPIGRVNPVMLPEMTEAAKAAHVAGCATVAFKIAPDGRATDATLLVEWPVGYGFGAAALATLPSDRFHPPQSDDTWHNLTMGMRPPPVGYPPR